MNHLASALELHLEGKHQYPDGRPARESIEQLLKLVDGHTVP